MPNKALALTLGVILTLSFSQAAFGAGTADTGKPLTMSELPHPPAFTPTSERASVCQAYVFRGWHYRVRYDYDTQTQRWSVKGYSAQRLRLSDGTPIPQTAANQDNGKDDPSSSMADSPCPAPAIPASAPVKLTGLQAAFSGYGKSPPKPTPAWRKALNASPPPRNPGKPGEQISNERSRGYWTTQTTYTWEVTSATPNGVWRLTGFRVKPTEEKSKP